MKEKAITPGLNDSFMALPDVQAATGGTSRSFIYEEISKGTFPAPVKLGRASRWSAAEISEWMDARRRARVG